MHKTLCERLKLLLAVVNELIEHVALLTGKVSQGNDALLIHQRRHAQRERFQYGATDTQLAAAFSGLLKLTLKGRLVYLPGEESRQQ